AKDLLRDLQQRTPGIQLADAQHAIANQYGFASWPRLKAHVESLPEGDSRTAAPASPFEGTWIANIAASQRHADNLFRSGTIAFAVAGDAGAISQITIDAAGAELRSQHTIRADGQPAALPGDYVLTARWIGPHVLETVATKAGEVVGVGTYEVSADGE